MWASVLGHEEGTIGESADHPEITQTLETLGLACDFSGQKEGKPEVPGKITHGSWKRAVGDLVGLTER